MPASDRLVQAGRRAYAYKQVNIRRVLAEQAKAEFFGLRAQLENQSTSASGATR